MNILEEVRHALAEDIGTGDITAALLPADQMLKATIISREPMLVCGQAWVDTVFAELDSRINCRWLVNEGEWLSEPADLCRVTGPARALLTGERTALNFLQTLSGTATQTYAFIQALKGTSTRLLDTRKTLPGLRIAQKYAVACAGGMNHRMGLYDAFLIKENHIAACGSIRDAITQARQAHPQIFLEIEVQTIAELHEALSCKPDRILLDNFDLPTIQEAVEINRPKICDLEVSGGVDLSSIRMVAETGIDYISVGALTKSVRAIDLSLLVGHSS
ncbi:MAG: carboxylating nicotinate-nucleotide diphosphorylase [Gammaproteobacteria bacterium]